MPIHNYGIRARHNQEDLVSRLAREIKQELIPGDSPDESPDIYIEEFGEGNQTQVHVHVVWEKWRGVPDMHRTGIILDAFKEAQSAVGTMAIAMGLTPDEAMQLGLDV